MPTPILTDDQKIRIKRCFQQGLDIGETAMLIRVPRTLIGFYYTQFRQDGVSKTSTLIQNLLCAKGTFGIAA